MASSADGSKLAGAVAIGGSVYTSTNAGLTWTETSATNQSWAGVTSSADGTRLVAAPYGGPIYTSTDAGATWTTTNAPNAYWAAVASSADGCNLLAAAYSGSIYRSTNSGTTWTPSGAPGQSWAALAASADGSKALAAAYGGAIYTSTNFGMTWNPSSAPIANWYSVASSADGTRLAGAVFGGGIYTSTNSGANWAPSCAPSAQWASVASSADGKTLVAAIYGGGIYVCGARPKLCIALANTNLTLCWTTNSAGYLLAQCSGVGAADWTAVTNVPTVTNAQYLVTLPPCAARCFYRLQTQSNVPAARPKLSLTLAGTCLALAWPTNLTGYALQQNTDMAGTNWTAVTNAVTVTNSQYLVTLPPCAARCFYRLRCE